MIFKNFNKSFNFEVRTSSSTTHNASTVLLWQFQKSHTPTPLNEHSRGYPQAEISEARQAIELISICYAFSQNA